MNGFLQRCLVAITPGVRLLLALMTVTFLAVELATLLCNLQLRPWLSAGGPAFWRGYLWVVLTYTLVPGGLADLVFSGVVLALLGSQVERAWSRARFWTYCLVTTAAGGLVKVLLQPANPQAWSGPSTLIVALVVASLPIMGNRKVQLFGLAEIPAKWCVLLLAAGCLLTAVSGAGLLDMLIPLAGGIAGGFLVALQSRWPSFKAEPGLATRNIRRLEL